MDNETFVKKLYMTYWQLLRHQLRDNITMTPTPTVDDLLKAVTAAEATYNADVSSEANIETAIATATAPLAAAKASVSTDATAYNSAVDAAIAGLQASKKTVPPPVA